MSDHSDTDMPYRIRPIEPHDAADWLALRDRLWEAEDHATEIARFFRGELDEPVEVLMAYTASGHAAGHVELSIRDDIAGLEGIRTGYIEGLYVDAAHRGTGLTQRLLRASERWAVAQQCAAFASDRDDRVIVHARFAGDGRAATTDSHPHTNHGMPP